MTDVSILIFIGGLGLGALIGLLAIAAFTLRKRRGGRDISKEEMKVPGPAALWFKWIAIVSLVVAVGAIYYIRRRGK